MDRDEEIDQELVVDLAVADVDAVIDLAPVDVQEAPDPLEAVCVRIVAVKHPNNRGCLVGKWFARTVGHKW